MHDHPDEHNLRAKYEEERLRKFEEDKARKRNSSFPWPAEVWKAAATAARAGILAPEPKFPIIITDFMTPQKVQKLAGLSSTPKVKWTTKTLFGPQEPDQPEKVQYCAITGRDQRDMIKDHSTGESIIIWFEGVKRSAWLARAEAQSCEEE